MTSPRAGLPRFPAYDAANAANARMVMTGMDARQILNQIRDHMWPAVDDRCIGSRAPHGLNVRCAPDRAPPHQGR